MTDHQDFEGLAAGYALHALEPDDEQRLAAHLVTCKSCARLVADTASLGAAFAGFLAPEAPPPGLRARILAATQAEPRAVSAPEPEPETPAAVQPPAGPAPMRHSVRSAGSPANGRPGRARTRRLQLRSRVAIGVLAAAVGVGVAVPVTLAVADHSSPTTSNTALAQWLLAPHAREVTLSGPANPSLAKAVVSDRGVYLVADGLPVNDRARSTYVLWAADKQGLRRAVTTFDVRGGAPLQLTSSKLPFNVSDISQVAVSYELGRKAPASPTKILLSGTTA